MEHDLLRRSISKESERSVFRHNQVVQTEVECGEDLCRGWVDRERNDSSKVVVMMMVVVMTFDVSARTDRC
jgi:hypothetical protein